MLPDSQPGSAPELFFRGESRPGPSIASHDRPGRDPSRDRRRPGREQRARVLHRPRGHRAASRRSPASTAIASGAIKRQAARFRIYGYNACRRGRPRADGRVGRHPLDGARRQPQGGLVPVDDGPRRPRGRRQPIPLRNPKVTGDDRKQLVIDGGPKSIRGRRVHGPEYQFRGSFQQVGVYLGEIRTDDEGRLLFLGGHGVSASPDADPDLRPERPERVHQRQRLVRRHVRRTGHRRGEDRRPFRSPSKPAWVITAPPDYGPTLRGVRTLYDLLQDLYIEAGWLPFPQRISFRDHVYPILHRLTQPAVGEPGIRHPVRPWRAATTSRTRPTWPSWRRGRRPAASTSTPSSAARCSTRSATPTARTTTPCPGRGSTATP